MLPWAEQAGLPANRHQASIRAFKAKHCPDKSAALGHLHVQKNAATVPGTDFTAHPASHLVGGAAQLPPIPGDVQEVGTRYDGDVGAAELATP